MDIERIDETHNKTLSEIENCKALSSEQKLLCLLIHECFYQQALIYCITSKGDGNE